LADYGGRDVECFLQINIIIPVNENELQMDVTIIKPNRDYLRIVTMKRGGLNLKPKHVRNVFFFNVAKVEKKITFQKYSHERASFDTL